MILKDILTEPLLVEPDNWAPYDSLSLELRT
jgi:hypothetical protein